MSNNWINPSEWSKQSIERIKPFNQQSKLSKQVCLKMFLLWKDKALNNFKQEKTNM